VKNFLATVSLSIGLTIAATAISPTQTDAPVQKESGPVVVKFSNPTYPVIARTANVSGTVEVEVTVRKDGTVRSAVALSGPPLLEPVAVDSAERSEFKCDECVKDDNPYRLIYTFKTEGECSCGLSTPNYPKVEETKNHITVTERGLCFCDPNATIGKKRSMKCLYLWRCER
jgi:hypothetical protein